MKQKQFQNIHWRSTAGIPAVCRGIIRKRYKKLFFSVVVLLLAVGGAVSYAGSNISGFWGTNSFARAATAATVIFYSNGGTAVEPQTTTTNAYFSSFPVITREGYSFDGWYVDEGLTSKASNPYYITNQVTVFYAKWTKVSVISLSASYETPTAEYGKLLDKSKITVIATYTNNSKGPVTDFTVQDLKVNHMGTNTFTVTYEGVMTTFTVMGIEKVYYTVTFNSNGGSVVAPISGIEKGTVITLPANPEREFYRFKGWYLDAAFTKEFTSSTPVEANITVFAKWEEIPDDPEEVTVYKLNKSKVFLKPGGQTSIFVPSYDPYLEGDLTFSSTNSSVVSVKRDGDNKGVITGKRAGTAYIKVKFPNGDLLKCKVTVGIKLDSLVLTKNRITLKVGKTYRIKTKLSPSSATNKKLAYTSGKKSVATVNSKGKITAKKKGTCYINIRTTDGSNLQKRFMVVVKKK